VYADKRHGSQEKMKSGSIMHIVMTDALAVAIKGAFG
jgi:hypothetical protein